MPEKIELSRYGGVNEAATTQADMLTVQLANNVRITSCLGTLTVFHTANCFVPIMAFTRLPLRPAASGCGCGCGCLLCFSSASTANLWNTSISCAQVSNPSCEAARYNFSFSQRPHHSRFQSTQVDVAHGSAGLHQTGSNIGAVSTGLTGIKKTSSIGTKTFRPQAQETAPSQI